MSTHYKLINLAHKQPKNLNKRERNELRTYRNTEVKKLKKNKPKSILWGANVVAKCNMEAFTAGKEYKVRNHFCKLFIEFDNVYGVEYISVKNDNNYTVVVALRYFKIITELDIVINNYLIQ